MSLPSESRARRFLGEFAVIVVGVLVALWIDAAYQAWEDRQVEREALEALRADLTETLDRLDRAIRVQAVGLPPIERPLPFEQLIRNPRYLAALSGVAFPEASFLDGYYRPVRSQIAEILELLDASLD